MRALPLDIGLIHFVGIGGIGMSGIAEVMHQLGYKVQGSDVAEGYVVEGLRKAGIPVMIGHSADNLGDAAVVVCSTAIKESNPEIQAAAERRLPRVRRAEMLAELMHDLGDSGHADAADADEVDRSDVGPKCLHAGTPPAKAARLRGVSAEPTISGARPPPIRSTKSERSRAACGFPTDRERAAALMSA